MVHKLDLFITQRTDATKVADEIKIILALEVHPPAVNAIEQYMNQQTDTKQSRLPPYCDKHVNTDDPILMQRMKADTATTWIVHRIGQEMIQVDQHCTHHDQPGFQERFGIDNPSDGRRYREVQNHVDDLSNQFVSARCHKKMPPKNRAAH